MSPLKSIRIFCKVKGELTPPKRGVLKNPLGRRGVFMLFEIYKSFFT